MSERLLYTEEEFSKLTGIPKATLNHWRKSNEGPPYVKLGRLVRYEHRTFMQYIENHTNDPERGGKRKK